MISIRLVSETQTMVDFPILPKRGLSRIPREWEIMKPFLDHYSLTPIWIDCDSTPSVFDEETGTWTGAVGKVRNCNLSFINKVYPDWEGWGRLGSAYVSMHLWPEQGCSVSSCCQLWAFLLVDTISSGDNKVLEPHQSVSPWGLDVDIPDIYSYYCDFKVCFCCRI